MFQQVDLFLCKILDLWKYLEIATECYKFTQLLKIWIKSLNWSVLQIFAKFRRILNFVNLCILFILSKFGVSQTIQFSFTTCCKSLHTFANRKVLIFFIFRKVLYSQFRKLLQIPRHWLVLPFFKKFLKLVKFCKPFQSFAKCPFPNIIKTFLKLFSFTNFQELRFYNLFQ